MEGTGLDLCHNLKLASLTIMAGLKKLKLSAWIRLLWAMLARRWVLSALIIGHMDVRYGK